MSSFDDPKPDECESCMWETPDLTKTDAYARIQGHGPFTPNEDKTWGWLCNVCRATWAGNAFQYPNQYPEARVLQMIAWQTNFLADEIAKVHKVLR